MHVLNEQQNMQRKKNKEKEKENFEECVTALSSKQTYRDRQGITGIGLISAPACLGGKSAKIYYIFYMSLVLF
ncbi:hypothetical protein BDV25DRAFT_158647 [Aspergillus avenaceus]|uniref:Uncharacterized protein n=1 Tax=Aspergillus avenaceus TaxID=36643 RepID=A0A5N6TPK0_ASPAV|nr:hypothetical protein BDV25DRAFT_158647 [Aspergillus avenaceus]